MNLTEITNKIKSVQNNKVRTIPMNNQNPLTGLYQIEICDNGNWIVIASGMTKDIAESLIRQSQSKVICG